MIYTSTEGKNRLLAITHLMEDINTADHGRLVKVWQIRDSPWLTTHLGANLNEDLVADGSDILTPGDGVAQHHLRWNG